MKYAYSLRCLALTILTAGALVALPGRAHAAFTFTLSQVGSDVVVDGSGSLNFSALSFVGNGTINAGIASSTALLIGGIPFNTGISAYNGGGLNGPTSFGTGSVGIVPSSGTGSTLGINGGSRYLYVPPSYTSGTLLTSRSIYSGQSFASLGFNPGTYTYTWGTGANADSLTITSIVPEPSTWVTLGAGGAVLGLMVRRRFRTRLDA